MKRWLTLFVLLTSVAFAEHPGWLLVEEQVEAEVAKPQITVVHLWAPWCPNSQAENADDGWAKFIAANPSVKFVFVTVRSSDDGVAYLKAHGVGGQSNLTLLHHPNLCARERGALNILWICRSLGCRRRGSFAKGSCATRSITARCGGRCWSR